MEQLLWYLLAGTRGGYNRIRIIEALRDRPRNAHQLADLLGLDYRTMRHHLDVLTKNQVLARPAGDAYAAPYFLSGLLLQNVAAFERIRAHVASASGGILAKGDQTGKPYREHEPVQKE